MNVLIYNHHFYPQVGGTEISGQIMARELVIAGHVVTVVTATPLPLGEKELAEGYQIVRSVSIGRLVKLAKKSDVVFSRGGVSLRALFAAKLLSRSFIAFHEMAPMKRSVVGRTGYELLRLLKKELFRTIPFHVTVSEALGRSLNLAPSVRLFRLYNPVSEEIWCQRPPAFVERDLDVIFVGRLLPSKGILVLRDALVRLCHRYQIKVAIAGPINSGPELEAAFSNFYGSIEFVGPLRGGRLRSLLSRARTIVVPSIEPEGMGMVAAEALANGTPVCASNQPALREVVDGAGLIHEIGDAAELSRQIETLLNDSQIWQKLSECGIKNRMRFSMDQYRNNLFSLMQLVEEMDRGSPAQRN